MGKILNLALCAAFFWSITASAETIEVPLKFIDKSNDRSKLRPVGHVFTMPVKEIPEGNWKLPALNAETPLYLLHKMGDKSFLIVFDEKENDANGYSRIYIDMDNDGDLAEEKPIDGTRDERRNNNGFFECSFSSIDISVTVDGGEVPYSIQLRISGHIVEKDGKKTLDYTQVYLYGASVFRGEFEVNGKTYSLMLNDTNINGSFTDKGELRDSPGRNNIKLMELGSDEIYMDTGELGYTDNQPYGEWLYIGSSLYRLNIDMGKRLITLTEATEKLFPLALSFKPIEIALLNDDDGSIVVARNCDDSSLSLPAGNYRLIDYRIAKNDDQGDRWEVTATGAQEALAVRVGEGVNPTLTFGEPFTPQVHRDDRRGSGNTILTFVTRGSNDEQVTMIAHSEGSNTKIPLSKKTGSYPKEPRYRIVKSDGELVARGTFEYG